MYKINMCEDTVTIMASLDGRPFIEVVDCKDDPYIIIGTKVIIGDGISPIIITGNSNPNYPIILPQDDNVVGVGVNKCGHLTTGISLLGDNQNGNYIACRQDQAGIALSTTNTDGGNISILAGDTGSINISSNQILPPAPGKIVFLGIDENNTVITIKGGETPPVNDLTAVGQVSLGTYVNDVGASLFIPSDGGISPIAFKASSGFVFQGDFMLPGEDETAVLTIDHNGKIGILLSSLAYKEQVQKLHFDEKDFDALSPCRYNYKGKNKLEYGLIAEEVFLLDSLKEALVVLDSNERPLTVNYQAVLMALLEQFLAYKEKMNQMTWEQERRITELESKIGNFIK